jgi:hypothetical protein
MNEYRSCRLVHFLSNDNQVFCYAGIYALFQSQMDLKNKKKESIEALSDFSITFGKLTYNNLDTLLRYD